MSSSPALDFAGANARLREENKALKAQLAALRSPLRPDLEEIEAELRAATPGPWRSSWDDETYDPDTGASNQWLIKSIDGNDKNVVFIMYYDGNNLACTEEDAKLIANAPARIEALLVEVRRLRDEVPTTEELAVLHTAVSRAGPGWLGYDNARKFLSRM